MNRYVLTFFDQSLDAFALADELTDSIKRGLFSLVEKDAEVFRETDEGDVLVFFSSDLPLEQLKDELATVIGGWYSPIENWLINLCTSEHDHNKQSFVKCLPV